MKQLIASLLSAFRWRSPARYGFFPYIDTRCNETYNLLFCDKVEVARQILKKASTEPVSPSWGTLVAAAPYEAGLRAIAADKSQESRARLLACYRLRELHSSPSKAKSNEVIDVAKLSAAAMEGIPKELLGVVVEVRLPEGLDVLAAYADGSVIYIHHKEAVSGFKNPPVSWRPTLLKLFDASMTAVDNIGPWHQARAAPPTVGMIRMSFLVTDGLYFGQGLLGVMDKDELAGPIIAASTELLKAVTKRSES